MNQDIRKQIIRNEWSVGLILNRFQLFLGRWALEKNLFKVIFNVARLLVNHIIRRSGRPPAPNERMMEHLLRTRRTLINCNSDVKETVKDLKKEGSKSPR